MFKVFTFCVAFIALTIAATQAKLEEPEGCEFCRYGINILFKWLLEPTSLDSMEYWMIRYVCQQMPDRDGCQIGVETWWSQIAHLIFSNDAAQKICKAMNSECTISKIWDCQTCKEDVSAFVEIISSDAAINIIVQDLSNELFCKDPELGLNPDQINNCQKYVTLFMPVAMKEYFDENFGSSICGSELYNVC